MIKKSCLQNWVSSCLILFLQAAFFLVSAQSQSSPDIDRRLRNIETDATLNFKQKFDQVSNLKKEFENKRFPYDSVYARILHRLGFLEWNANNHVISASIVENTQAAIRINTSGAKNISPRFAVNSYINLGFIYEDVSRFEKALSYFDSALLLNKNYPDQILFSKLALNAEAYIYIVQGDYQKCIEICTQGITISTKDADSQYLANFYNYRAFGYTYMKQWQLALEDANRVLAYATPIHYQARMVDAIKLKAISYAGLKDFAKADSYFSEALKRRIKLGDAGEGDLAGDYVDYGNYFLNKRQDFSKAVACYIDVVNQPSLSQDNLSVCQAYTNIAQAYFRTNQLEKSKDNYNKAFSLFHINSPTDFLENATTANLSLVSNKDLLFVLLNNKTEILLALYKKSKDEKWLRACLQTALVTDSVITQTRHEQLGEQSKLYWRNKTRDLYGNAIEASYLAGDAGKAFYFFEKSRSVLLYDKLNELGAAAHLSPEQTGKEENYQVRLIELQQKLSSLNPGSDEYNKHQSAFFQTKEELERYIRSLEKSNPIYYQKKYVDNALSLSSLQTFLAKNNQSFIHYFKTDSAIYVLGITKNKTSFIKIPAANFDAHQLSQFINLCSNKEALMNGYPAFASLAQTICQNLFQPLAIPKGNVAICTDNFFIPFEALCSDAKGKNYLLYNYNFSYVYSARSLLTSFAHNAPTGNFIGFAPVSFSPSLQVFDLKNSSDALTTVAGFYSNYTLFTQQNATRNNFIKEASHYSVVTIFSHAHADTTDTEPVLYMQDSLVHLSDLQRLNNSSIQFVLLSACQTNIGKNATGEGIYSLARGFASVGVPSVSATLWKADEGAVYEISTKFNEYLAKGMNKSEALQKAKIWYLQTNSDNENSMPFFWANMVLIGNSEPIVLTSANHSWVWVSVIGCLLIIAAIFVFYRKRKRQFLV